MPGMPPRSSLTASVIFTGMAVTYWEREVAGKDLREELGTGYTEALWTAYPKVPRPATGAPQNPIQRACLEWRDPTSTYRSRALRL